MVTTTPWTTLVSQAVLGARSGQTVTADGALGAHLSQVPAGDLATALALVGGWRRAGRKPLTCNPPPAPATPDTRPIVSSASASLLRGLLGDSGDQRLVHAYLEACAGAHRRIPADLVPDLLDLGRATAGIRQAVRTVTADVGAWLAAQHDAWEWAQSTSAGATWTTGTNAERVALLRTLRAQDAAAASALIASTWDEDTPVDRTTFLEVLVVGLCLADEPLLERALDDRRKEVRQVAGSLLRRLPGSQLGQRCRERVMPCLAWKSGLFGTRLTIEPPATYDRSWARDGISEKPPTGTGERAWWLQHLLAAVPPTTWSEAWKATPEAILAAVAKTDWASPVRTGLLHACAHTPDHSWILTLLAGNDAVTDAYDLLAHLPPASQEDLLERIRPGETAARGRWFHLLSRLGTSWSLAATQRIVSALMQESADHRSGFVQLLAYQLHPLGVGPLMAAVEPASTTPAMDRARVILDLRRQIHLEFS